MTKLLVCLVTILCGTVGLAGAQPMARPAPIPYSGVLTDAAGWAIVANATDTPHGTRRWQSVEVERPEVTVSLPDEVIDSCLVAKCHQKLGRNGYADVFGLDIRLLELVEDPDHITGRWLGTFSVEAA